LCRDSRSFAFLELDVNHESEWRLERGRWVAELYAENPKLRALVVAGSVGRGWADEWSDIELDLFWSEPPTDRDRMSVIERAGGTIVSFYPLEDEEWSDAYLVNGLKFEVSAFLVSTLDRHIADVIDQYDATVEKQLRLAALQNSIALHGEDLIARWREKIADYPDALAEKIIRDNVDFGGWNTVELSFARGDLLLAYDLLSKVQKQVMAVLLALNRTYMGHPRGKWLVHFAEGMRYKPEQFEERMLYALRAGSVDGAREMDGVIEETFALVEQQFPQIDLTEIKRDVRFRRTLTAQKTGH
jgi:hypothetical protein